MLNQVAPVKDKEGPLLFRPCSHEKPLGDQAMGYSFAFHGGMNKTIGLKKAYRQIKVR